MIFGVWSGNTVRFGTFLWNLRWVEVPVIVMITNLIEKNRVKAEVYWPTQEDEIRAYGDIFVQLVCTS